MLTVTFCGTTPRGSSSTTGVATTNGVVTGSTREDVQNALRATLSVPSSKYVLELDGATGLKNWFGYRAQAKNLLAQTAEWITAALGGQVEV
jgi:hypothetical protein